jgi:hypothetical protein
MGTRNIMNTRPLTRAITISFLIGLLAIIATAQTPDATKTDPVARLSTELEPLNIRTIAKSMA